MSEYRSGLPTVEQVRAHEARGGWWMRHRIKGTDAELRELSFQRITHLVWHAAHIGSALYEYRPCLPDGTPCAWPGEPAPTDPWTVVREAAGPLRTLIAGDNSHAGDSLKEPMAALVGIVADDRQIRASEALDDLAYWLGFMSEDFQAQARPLVEALRGALGQIGGGR